MFSNPYNIQTCLYGLHFSVTFDTVDHEILLRWLEILFGLSAYFLSGFIPQ